MMSQEIAIRSIQHYMYCPHRWGLLEIDKAWAENIFVTKANLMHERVHGPDNYHVLRGRKVFTSVPVYNDKEEYNLYGVTDCLELSKSEDGISIDSSTDKYKLCIVEYKPTKPKNKDYNEEDMMQVFAQKLCVDYIFGCDSEAEIYYADMRKRVSLPVKDMYEEYDDKLKQILSEMRKNLLSGHIPPVEKNQKCSGCSMKDMCMPKLRCPKNFKLELKKLDDSKYD